MYSLISSLGRTIHDANGYIRLLQLISLIQSMQTFGGTYFISTDLNGLYLYHVCYYILITSKNRKD